MPHLTQSLSLRPIVLYYGFWFTGITRFTHSTSWPIQAWYCEDMCVIGKPSLVSSLWPLNINFETTKPCMLLQANDASCHVVSWLTTSPMMHAIADMHERGKRERMGERERERDWFCFSWYINYLPFYAMYAWRFSWSSSYLKWCAIGHIVPCSPPCMYWRPLL